MSIIEFVVGSPASDHRFAADPVIGVLVWLGAAYAFRGTASIDRRLAGWLRRDPLPGAYRSPESQGLLARVRTVTIDPQTWKDAGWLVGNSIIGFAVALIAISVTALVLAWITLPIWWWAIPDPHDQYATLNFGIFTVTSLGWAFVTMALGLITLPLALLLNRGIAAGHAGIVATVLGPSERQRLNARVRELASTRSDVVSASNEQLRRIERDLHDGAQARLVALAMELGMAEEELANDPDAARAAVRKARDEALGALGELRDCPAACGRRCCRSAGSASPSKSRPALHNPGHGQLTGDLDSRRTTFATAVYFVVAEALTNAAKHSRSVAPASRSSASEDAIVARSSMTARAALMPPARASPGCAIASGARRRSRRVEPAWRSDPGPSGAAVRVVICEDHALVRDGLERLLLDHGFEVAASVDNAEAFLEAVEQRAARRLRRRRPAAADLHRRGRARRDRGPRSRFPACRSWSSRSTSSRPTPRELLADGEGGVGYLLKDRVADPVQFVDAVRRVADGGTALDPEAVAQLLGAARPPGRARPLTPREREVLSLMAEGRSNGAIAEALVVTERRGREARLEHLREARPAGHGEGPPPGAGRAGLAPGERLDTSPPRSRGTGSARAASNPPA